MPLPRQSVAALGDGVLRVAVVICALINPAGAEAEPLIQVRARRRGRKLYATGLLVPLPPAVNPQWCGHCTLA